MSYLRKLFVKVKTSVFFKNILVVMAGTGAAQIISLLLYPVISRLFTPSDFGISGSFDAVAGIIAAGVTLEYSQALMLPKEKEKALGLLAISLLCTGAVTVLTLLFCLLAPATMNGLMKSQGTWLLALLVLATLISGFNYSQPGLGRQDQGLQSDFGVSSDPVPVGKRIGCCFRALQVRGSRLDHQHHPGKCGSEHQSLQGSATRHPRPERPRSGTAG
ncbi:MAG: hypothetical protein M0C28_27655 [Candidatus Moduliflexus flocculans]|nr:hypothetical protein [Candidatus Moduliflexus flocculans]